MAVWTLERVEELKTLWASGMSAVHIACKLGFVSRNAVLGKVDRLGLTSRRTGRTGEIQVHIKRPKRGSNLWSARRMESAEPKRVYDYQPAPETQDIPIEQRKSLVQLTSKTCHWPVGDPQEPDLYFCGGEVTKKAYCAHHARIAYLPPRVRV